MYKNREGIQFSKKDTWSLDSSLSPIIHSALVKFKEVIEKSSHAKCPMEFLVETDDWDADVDNGQNAFIEALDKMIYAFGDNAPNIMKYDFKYEPTELHGSATGYGSFVWDMRCTNPVAHDQYVADCELHEKRRSEGHELFGKHYNQLWW